MRIFLAGATGVLGRRLIPLLLADGHTIIGTTRTSDKLDALRRGGVEAVVVDALDRHAVMAAVSAARPDVVIHQLTALANFRNMKKLDEEFALTNRLRTEATDHLLEAAQAAGARRFIAQSYAGWPTERTGGRVKTEEDPLDSNPPAMMTRTHAAIRHLETVVAGATGLAGIVLRYGGFYGPGTSLGADGHVTAMVSKRQFPVVGAGTGVWSFIHIDDAAEATRLAVVRGEAGIYNVVDNEPAEVSEWLPGLARAIDAKPPRHLPAWLGRLFIGEPGIAMMTNVRGASNARAKQAFGWQPRYASWRDGFRHGLA